MGAGLHGRWRRASLALLAAAVLGVHLWLGDWFIENRLAWGEGERVPPRLEAVFARELEVQAPPAVAPQPAPRPHKRKKRVEPAQPAASASQLAKEETPPPPPEPVASEPTEPSGAVAEAASPPDSIASAAETTSATSATSAASAAEAASAAIAAVPATSAASQPQAAVFEWPPSTRLSYRVNGYMSGQYGRGPLEGSARVQWIRDGSHYQVQLDVSAAGVFTRRMTSDGELSELGLRPKRFDQEDVRFGFASPPLTIHFLPDAIVLPDGAKHERPEGVQDIASQLVQMTWLFATRPEMLNPGKTVDLPLALSKPQRIELFTYEVVQAETVDTPFGSLDTFHVKPRSLTRPGTLSMQTWVAPSLQYLPVRVRITQNEDNYLDLVIERKPQQAAPAKSETK